MIKVLIGDIFKSKAQTLVNTVNCVGIMGKGLALEINPTTILKLISAT